jgi:hypothetical protein
VLKRFGYRPVSRRRARENGQSHRADGVRGETRALSEREEKREMVLRNCKRIFGRDCDTRQEADILTRPAGRQTGLD